MASLQLLALELSKAFVLYRQPRPAQAEFELLVRTWGDVLADVSDGEFREGMRRTQAALRFFPVPADVMRYVEEVRGHAPVAEQEALPERTRTLEEQCLLNADWCAKILDNMRDPKDARKQGRPDKPVDVQLAELHALGVEQ